MSMRKITLFLLSFSFIGIYVMPVNAQTETPPDEEATGEVTGFLVNKSPDGIVPDSVDLMLHVWDQDYRGQGMYHGQSLPDGSFVFPDVALNPSLIYAVMANHDGATYFSDTITPEPGDTSLEIEVPIYETTGHLSEVAIDQAHVLFSFGQGGMEILEVYILSNIGDYTVKDAVTLDDGRSATLSFGLPEDAANISFKDNEQERFIQFSGGFADTSPLVPGRGSGEIVLRYITPYDDQASYTFSPPVPVENVQFLVVQDENITVEGDALTPEGPQTVQDGTTFDVYTHTPLQTGESVEINISGEPTIASAPVTDTSEPGKLAKTTPNFEIGLGALVLGLALVGTGIWWWRKPHGEDEIGDLLDQSDFRDLVAQIVELDETYQAAEIPEDEYQQRRRALTDEGKALLMGEE